MKTFDLKLHECWKVKSAKMPQSTGGSLPEVGACLSRMVETVEDVAFRGFVAVYLILGPQEINEVDMALARAGN